MAISAHQVPDFFGKHCNLFCHAVDAAATRVGV
jgi:hypothetical protein